MNNKKDENSILNYPQTPCYACKSDTFWHGSMAGRKDQNWVCAGCHPPTQEVRLKMRIVKGTYLLNKIGRELSKTEFDNACDLLKALWQQLALSGLTACLYMDGTKKLKKCVPALDCDFQGLECFACANDYWWVVELKDAVNKKNKRQVDLADLW